MPDLFPEAFERFERQVDVRRFENYRQLAYAFAHWAGRRWQDTYLQNRVLKKEGMKLGFEDAELPKYWQRKSSTVWRTNARYGKHRGLRDKQISIINDGIRKGVSANKIQRQLKNQGLGLRRKELLRNIREMKMKSAKADSKKYMPKKYRK